MLHFLDTLFLQPLMLIYEHLSGLSEPSGYPGPQLIAFSVVLNLLLLPIYKQMEQRFRRTAAVREQVARDVARMKKHFRGRERYFYVRAVHRQYGYHPISDLLGSADLLVQILVFATVYRYLCGLDTLVGASFGPIADLSRPDGLLAGINVLPLLMTAINALTVSLYIDEPAKRRQAWVLAGIFLVLLYQSAAGLVLYWTTNNLYSLIRTIAERRYLRALPVRVKEPLARLASQR